MGQIGLLVFLLAGCNRSSNIDMEPFESCEKEVARLQSVNPSNRRSAAWRLEGCPSNIAVSPLTSRLSVEKEDYVMRRIAHSLSRFPEAVDQLEPLVSSKDKRIRLYGAMAIYAPKALQYERLLHDPDPDVRIAYAEKLAGLYNWKLRVAARSETNQEVKTWYLRYANRKVAPKRLKMTIKDILKKEKEEVSY